MLHSQKKIIACLIGGFLSLASPSYCAVGTAEHTSPVLVDETRLILNCDHGKFQPLHSPTNCEQPARYAEDILVWDQARLNTPPKWQDLWNVVQLPGKRALPKSARLTLEIALLSDGVPPQRIYRTLATSRGVAHAFHRLDQLRPYIVWWDTPSKARDLMQKKAFLIGVTPRRSMVPSMKTSNASLFMSGTAYTPYTAQFWTILREANAADVSPNTPISDRMLEIDNHFWTVHAPVLEARFAAWLRR
ncbi:MULTISPECIES: extracellular solute-binding protein [unclassified Saccharibacter]|uniref:extracellular solute-binding protein n=1 Tax=unclassified Saccharibacter TaxID=2648722 RepID=UPI001325E588|nr:MULTISPECIES: extracellular solute-binding protein [unclassified Saccharibacter]MXV36645.1 extracellular solute-binding protein [Saccharibacter sp. EH611]MXV58795.1 extracellular solute-binding protein [Saccharibacter sp. EH70]MXV65593.1 extracellular solute-binding protein [Saccharibacter sp. EH60]